MTFSSGGHQQSFSSSAASSSNFQQESRSSFVGGASSQFSSSSKQFPQTFSKKKNFGHIAQMAILHLLLCFLVTETLFFAYLRGCFQLENKLKSDSKQFYF